MQCNFLDPILVWYQLLLVLYAIFRKWCRCLTITKTFFFWCVFFLVIYISWTIYDHLIKWCPEFLIRCIKLKSDAWKYCSTLSPLCVWLSPQCVISRINCKCYSLLLSPTESDWSNLAVHYMAFYYIRVRLNLCRLLEARNT